MTALLPRRPATETTWGTMPGWTIVVDLTPPELVAARQLKGLKKLIAAGLVLVVLVCAGSYMLARRTHASAQADYQAVTDRTTALTAAAASSKLSTVTRMRSLTASIRAQLETATTQQADVAGLLRRITAARPAGVAVTSMNVTITGADADGESAATTLNTSGHTTVGAVTLAGTAADMTEVATFVTKLGSVPGVVNVIPTGNTRGSGSGKAQWTVTAQITDGVLAHPAQAAAVAATGEVQTTTTVGGS